MNKQQADYCDKLQSGNIEVAVPCENALGLLDVKRYTANLRGLGVKDERRRGPRLAFAETKIIVNDILTGLGK